MKYKHFNSRKDISKLLKLNYSTLKKWINEYLTLPEEIFILLINNFPEAEKFKKSIVKYVESNWGSKIGGDIRKKQIGDIHKFYLKLREKKENMRIIQSDKKRNNFIITDKNVLEIIKNDIDLKYLLATYILTDGSLTINKNNYRLCFFTKDESLKRFIFQVLMKESTYAPSIYKDPKKLVYYIRVSDRILANKLFKLNSSYKKSPSKNESYYNYISSKQPSLDFIKFTDEKTRNYCIRLAFSTDGYISLDKNKKFTLALACYNKTLCFEWLEVFKLSGINSVIINRRDSISGVAGVRVKKEDILKFYKIGGFINGVKISKKSKKYKGIEKNKLLKQVVKLGARSLETL